MQSSEALALELDPGSSATNPIVPKADQVYRDNTPKSQIIEERKANLPLPEQPPVASDWQSADERNVNVGSGGVSGDISHSGLGSDTLRNPATGDSSVRADGADLKKHTAVGGGRVGVDGIPNDAVTRDKKHNPGLEDTTNKDYGYPHKNDPSSGLK
jgi:hypothetical protein